MYEYRVINIFRLMILAGILLFNIDCAAQSSKRTADLQGKILDESITESGLENMLDFLTSDLCQGRACSSIGSQETVAWLCRQFRYNSLEAVNDGSYVLSSRVDNDGEASFIVRNVIGMIPASIQTDRYVIVAAHYDNLGILSGQLYPGADSNASGISAIIAIAHAIQELKSQGVVIKQNILFVALDAKQKSMAGAEALASSIKNGHLTNPRSSKPFKLKDLSFMVNIDIIGSTLEPVTKDREDYMIMLTNSESFQRRISEVNVANGYFMDLNFDYYGSRDFTQLFFRRTGDQKVFLDNGIPSVLFTSGITMMTNKPEDTLQTLNLPIMKTRIELISRWLLRSIG